MSSSAVNPYKNIPQNLRNRVFAVLYRCANSPECIFDVESVRRILHSAVCPRVPVELQTIILAQFSAFGEALRKFRVERKRSNRTLNRMLGRLHNSCLAAMGRKPWVVERRGELMKFLRGPVGGELALR